MTNDMPKSSEFAADPLAEADALAGDLRAYLRLLDRCGMRHVAPAATGAVARPASPVIDSTEWAGVAAAAAATRRVSADLDLRSRDDDAPEPRSAPPSLSPKSSRSTPSTKSAEAMTATPPTIDDDIETSPAAVATDDEGDVTVADEPRADVAPLDASPETDELRRRAEAEAIAAEETAERTAIQTEAARAATAFGESLESTDADGSQAGASAPRDSTKRPAPPPADNPNQLDLFGGF